MGKPTRHGRSGLAFLRNPRLAPAAAAPLAVLLVAVLAVAVPTIGAPARTAPDRAEQATGSPNPNYRRVALTSPGMTFELMGQPAPLVTGALTGEVDLARPEGNQAMETANLVLHRFGNGGDVGQVDGAIRPGVPVTFQYDQATQSLIFNPGLEFAAESEGVTGAEPIGLLNTFELTVTHPA